MADVGKYQINVTLKRSKPPIWRRLQLRGNTKAFDLGAVNKELAEVR